MVLKQPRGQGGQAPRAPPGSAGGTLELNLYTQSTRDLQELFSLFSKDNFGKQPLSCDSRRKESHPVQAILFQVELDLTHVFSSAVDHELQKWCRSCAVHRRLSMQSL